ncbi:MULTISPECIES: hypothetical protein [unclassified Streptomyces]|uniref:hypothetical protein n=1 Tax=unclassified Streptomyces TaxID=2593676 RepID=UPI002E10A3C4|nr:MULTISPECIES: hypothetical protein [unclassified Streptomyces]WSR23445.1 hypothetical protein OG573_32935 [Streptomyces sp. NBC_01205]
MSRQNLRAKAFFPGGRRSRPARLLATAALATLAGITLPHPAAHAVTPSVPCSVPDLVEAINAANSTPGADTIRLAHKCTYKLVAPDPAHPANGLPVITSEITIDGNGATITRAASAPDFRILLVDKTGNLTLNKATISGGRATDCPLFPGEAVCGGGINNQGTLTVNHSRIVHNSADTARDGFFVEGGGIDSDGPATVNDTEISHNTAVFSGTTQTSADGGGIANDGPLTLNHTRVTDNTVGVPENTDSFAFGAGVAPFAEAEIEHSTISRNHASAPGGTALGAVTTGNPVPGETTTLEVTDSVIAENTTSAPGGLAVGGGLATGFPVSLTRTRVIDNTATAPGGTARGGGIHISRTGGLTLTGSTVRGNTARASGGTARGGGISNAAGGTLTADQSHFTRNTAEAPDGGTAQGGGIFHAVGTTTLKNKSSVTGNTATDGDGGGIFKESGTLTLDDTVVRRNRPNNCAPAGSVPGCTG